MKELTIEEKAKQYNKALNVALETYQTQPMYKDWLEKMFPELKESEDERIVKELLTFFRESIHGGHILTNKEYDSWIAWLEKQGEQEPANKVETFKDKLLELFQRFRWKGTPTNGDIIEYVDAHIQELIDTIQKSTDEEMKTLLQTEYEKGRADAIAEMQKSWSEEDEKILDGVITNYESGYLPSVEKRDEIIEKLESFKERHTWKPTDEQMEVLHTVVYLRDLDCYGGLRDNLLSLYNDLKKLKGE